MQQTPKAQKANKEASSSVTGLILTVNGFVLAAFASTWWLAQNRWVAGQKDWLISRSSALAAYAVLSIVIVLGLLLSHPRNKDTWRWTPRLFPWHQALMSALFALIGLHIFFTAIDSKSGVSGWQALFPVHSKYHPLPILLGGIGLYLFLAVVTTSALRKWLRLWLPIHRVSWLMWIAVTLHGWFGGTDTSVRPMYWAAAVVLFAVFFWRHWVPGKRRPLPLPQRQTEISSAPQKGGNAV